MRAKRLKVDSEVFACALTAGSLAEMQKVQRGGGSWGSAGDGETESRVWF